MKTVFEGIVNGQVYNNADDYNKAIIEALKTGKCEASSQIKAINEPTHPECVCLSDDGKRVDLNYFDQLNKLFADGISGNEYKEYYERTSKELDEFVKGIKNCECDQEEIENKLRNIDLILSSMEIADEKLQTKADEAFSRYDKITMKQEINALYLEKYMNAFDILSAKRKKSSCGNCGATCDCKNYEKDLKKLQEQLLGTLPDKIKSKFVEFMDSLQGFLDE